MEPKKATRRSKGAPGKTVDSIEAELISLATDLAKKQLSEGTASAMVITHYLKLGTTKARLEMSRLENENKLLEAKTKALQSQERVEELYAKALLAMQSYSGNLVEGEVIDDEA